MTAQADALMGIFGFKRVEEKAMDKVIDTRRALFEAAYNAERLRQGKVLDPAVYLREKDNPDDYFISIIQSAWFGFNAALDAVEITDPFSGQYGPYSENASSQMRAAIESTSLGIKIK